MSGNLHHVNIVDKNDDCLYETAFVDARPTKRKCTCVVWFLAILPSLDVIDGNIVIDDNTVIDGDIFMDDNIVTDCQVYNNYCVDRSTAFKYTYGCQIV